MYLNDLTVGKINVKLQFFTADVLLLSIATAFYVVLSSRYSFLSSLVNVVIASRCGVCNFNCRVFSCDDLM